MDPLDASTTVVAGPIHPIAMNFFDPSGVLIDSVRVERQASMARISLRSVCHCNPGLREVALGFSTLEMAAAFKDKEKTGCATMSCSM